MNFTQEDILFVEKAIEIKNKGYYLDGTQLTEVYNRVLNKHVNPTNCGSCIRQRVCELETALNDYKTICKRQEELKAQEALKNNNPINSPSDANKTIVNDIPAEHVEEKKRVGRPKRK